MHCPSLAELPPPPPGRNGWPWTEESPRTAGEFPRLTIVTPSYMQGQYLEQTIRSVLLQNYPNLEYFIFDGGSTDCSREIIEKYSPWLAGWRCEKDKGQAAVINEGWARGTGKVLAWINSDDWYHPGALAAVAPLCGGTQPADWVGGPVDDCRPDGAFRKRHPAWPTPLPQTLSFHEFGYHQPGMFWSRHLIDKVGRLDESMHLCFDLEFWARSLAAGFTLRSVETPVACFRQHPTAKTSSRYEELVRESRENFQRHSGSLSAVDRKQSAEWLREFTADFVLHIVYRHVREARRTTAASWLLRELRTLMKLRPRRLLCGAMWRVLVTGRPPAWIR